MTAVEELVHVQCMPMAYQAALLEVSRRRAFGRLYVSKVLAPCTSTPLAYCSLCEHVGWAGLGLAVHVVG